MSPNIRRTQLLLESEGGVPEIWRPHIDCTESGLGYWQRFQDRFQRFRSGWKRNLTGNAAEIPWGEGFLPRFQGSGGCGDVSG